MLFWIINIALLVIIIFLFVLLSWFWPPDSPWSLWWRTNSKIAKSACVLTNIKKDEVVYELGSGDAQFLITAAKRFGAKCVGIEIDPLRVFVSKIKIKLNSQEKNIKIIKKNFFDVDISDADVVFVYLVPKALERLRPKFEKELKKGTRIVSLKYKMNMSLESQDKQHRLFLYKM